MSANRKESVPPALSATTRAEYSPQGIGPDYDEFLYAPVVEDRQGMMVTVLSLLARADLDPWAEAARLAGLPRDAAVQTITDLILYMDAGPASANSSVTREDAPTCAARLVGLLPSPAARRHAMSNQPDTNLARVAARNALIFGAIYLLFTLIGERTRDTIDSHQPPTPVVAAAPATTSPPSQSGR